MAQETSDGPGPLLLSDDEKRALELYDKLQQLQLEIALITAQNNYVPGTTRSPTQGGEELVKTAQHELLDSRARYVLRNEAVESVVVANPIMQAVHSGPNASPVERDLQNPLHQRDATATLMARQAASLRTVHNALAEVEGQAQRLTRANAAQAGEVLRLAAERNQGRDLAAAVASGEVDAGLAQELAALEAQTRASRRKWRVVKGAASAIVAGSGVDWARDGELRDIVLDEAEEDDGDEDGVAVV